MEGTRFACLVALLGIGTVFLSPLVLRLLPFEIRYKVSDPSEFLNEETAFYYRGLDKDGDGLLSPEEILPILEKYTGKATGHGATSDHGEQVTLRAKLEPIDIKTMRGVKKDNEDASHVETEKMPGLEAWTKPEKVTETFSAEGFRVFLPKLQSTEVGIPWFLFRSPPETTFSNNRYFPGVAETEQEEFITSLLKMFHPRPFTRMRFAPQGGVAVLRGKTDAVYDIYFRLHIEFQLNEPPAYPFWFTPSQMKGRLVITRDGKHVSYFHMFVPSSRNLNVDMEWMDGPDEHKDMHVDIGYMPEMDLESIHPSAEKGIVPKIVEDINYVSWEHEISAEKAELELEKAFYPFKEVSYHNFTSAFEVAEKENKLVHSIVMWGALDDQSC